MQQETAPDSPLPPDASPEDADTTETVAPENGENDLLDTAGASAGILPPVVPDQGDPAERPSKDW